MEDSTREENDYERDLNKEALLKKIQKSIDPYPYLSKE